MYPHIILFDGICNLCNATVHFVIKRDKATLFRFAAIQSETGQSLIGRYTDDITINTLFYIRKGIYLKQSTAILYIFKDLGKGWQLLFPFILIPAGFRDSIYQLISRNRYKLFGKQSTCMVPNPGIKDRFL